jgi:hypothetical protein
MYDDDRFALAGQTWTRAVFTGTTFCSGCRSKIRTGDGVLTYVDARRNFRICLLCAGILRQVAVGRVFEHADWKNADSSPAFCGIVGVADDRVHYRRINGRVVDNVPASCQGVDFIRRFAGWRP